MVSKITQTSQSLWGPTCETFRVEHCAKMKSQHQFKGNLKKKELLKIFHDYKFYRKLDNR